MELDSDCWLKVRHLSVHEYVSMSLLRDAGVPTPKFGVAKTAEEARDIAKSLDCLDLVVKAQVGICYVQEAIHCGRNHFFSLKS